MSVIYEPSGKAREYSELACNIFNGCRHKCKYCYCPSISFKTLEDWSSNPMPRKDILKNIEKDLIKTDKNKELLFCFMTDPFQSPESTQLTVSALELCEKAGMRKVNVLTKGGLNALPSFPILKRNNWKYGSTIIFKSEDLRKEWESGAAPISERIETLKIAKSEGIFTWVSVEPVVDPNEALKIITELQPFVDFWKVGKLNHFPEVEKKIDWRKFLNDCQKIIPAEKVYYKKDLLKYQ